MQAEPEKQQQHSWKISIHAKSHKNFHFRFKATNVSPTWKINRLSVLLKIRRFLLTVNSESSPSSSTNQKNQGKTTSRFLRLFKKIRFRSTKKQYPEAKFPFNQLQRFSYEEPICVASLLLGILAVLFIPKIFKGIMIYTLVMLLHIAFLSKRFKTGKPIKLLIIIGVALACPALLFDSSFYPKYDQWHA